MRQSWLWIFVCSMGCAPAVDVSGEATAPTATSQDNDGGGSEGSVGTPMDGDTSASETASDATSMSLGDTGLAEATGESSGDGDGPPTYCDGDLTLADPARPYPYADCMRGLATFTARVGPGGGTSFGAYAQFYDVDSFVPTMNVEEILDPWEGPYDCSLTRYSNSGYGGETVVVWEDAGDLSFVIGDESIHGSEYGDPVDVLGYDWPQEDFEPRFGAPHGFVTTGDTAPPFDAEGVVTLPQPFEGLTPDLSGSTVRDSSAVVLRWDPPYGDDLIVGSLRVRVSGDWDFTLSCTAPDTGELEFPAELVEQLPRPTDAQVSLDRQERILFGADAGRFIFISATTSTDGELRIE